MKTLNKSPLHRTAAVFSVALIALFSGLTGAAAQKQGIAVLVNDQPITNYDVQQRMKFVAATQRQAQNAKLRQTIIDELIDETLIKQDAKRLNISVTHAEVDRVLEGMASRGGRTAAQLKQILRQMGIDVSTLQNRIASQLAWRQVIQRRFRRDIQIRERDIDEFLSSISDKKEKKNTEYDLQSILLLVPKGASKAAVGQRVAEARRLGAKFSSCDTSRKLAASIRDVVVRDIGKRQSVSLTKEQADLLAGLGAGKVTPPKVTPDGVEMLAICYQRETSGEEVARLDAQNELVTKEFSELAKRHLFDLRQNAVIERRG